MSLPSETEAIMSAGRKISTRASVSTTKELAAHGAVTREVCWVRLLPCMSVAQATWRPGR